MRFEDCICVGLIGSPHGVKGYVKVKHFTESPRGVTAYGEVFNYKMEKIILDFKGLSKNLGIYSIKGITNRDLAESVRGIKLFVKLFIKLFLILEMILDHIEVILHLMCVKNYLLK